MEAKIIMGTDKGQVSILRVEKSDFKDLLKHSEKVATKLWNNKENDIWDTV